MTHSDSLPTDTDGARCPTEQQFGKLLILGSGNIALAPGRRDWKPLLKHGWVEVVAEDEGHRGFLPPLRITSAGLRALAAAVERYGLGDFKRTTEIKHVSEHPAVTRVKAHLKKSCDALRESERERWRIERTLARTRRALDGEL